MADLGCPLLEKLSIVYWPHLFVCVLKSAPSLVELVIMFDKLILKQCATILAYMFHCLLETGSKKSRL
ncbi:hypothetical protein P8452_29651 [Trifolium repens]|nr:hypothetical protein P8452_29651 [Trifolium repens]